MKIEENYSLEKHNTFHLPAKTRWYMEYENEEELTRILLDEYFQECNSLHIGGGSNLLFINDFDGIVLHSRIRGIEIVEDTGKEVLLRIGAGEVWDDVVSYSTEKGWSGIENLSLIPGEAGAAVVQNIGAYGVEIKDVVVKVETINQLTREKRSFTREECEYSYRHSFFKDEQHDPYIVTYCTIRLSKELKPQLEYGQLKKALQDVEPLTPKKIRERIIQIRKEKLPDPDKLGNAGSYFTNPLVDPEKFEQIKKNYPGIASFQTEEGKIKLSAGWMIEQCGFKGKSHGEVGVYEKQALVIVNLGQATGNEIALVAESIRMAVMEKFGVELMPEVKYIH